MADITVTGEVQTEILAENIEKLAKAAKALQNTRLTRNAIVVLLQGRTKMAKADINAVLDALGDLERAYLKPVPKKTTTPKGKSK